MSSEDRFSDIREGLENGFSRASGALKSAYTRPRDAVYSVANVRDDDGDIDQRRRRMVQGAGLLGTGVGVGALADKYSDGELDGDLNGGSGPGIGFFGNQSDPGNSTATQDPTETPTDNGRSEETDTPGDTETPRDTETPQDTDTPTDTETPTDTATEQPYSGEIDGSQYELQEVPGPVEGEGYLITDEVLESYDPDGWADITDEEEYEVLGTGADWYLQEDAVIGINEREQISRTFPEGEFGYDTEGLYEDIREEAN